MSIGYKRNTLACPFCGGTPTKPPYKALQARIRTVFDLMWEARHEPPKSFEELHKLVFGELYIGENLSTIKSRIYDLKEALQGTHFAIVKSYADGAYRYKIVCLVPDYAMDVLKYPNSY